MLRQLLGQLTADLALDLGTAATRLAWPGEGIVVAEPSVVAVHEGSRQILGRGAAVGNLAQQLHGRTPGSIEVLRPLSGGVITDYRLCEAMLRYFFRKAFRQRWWLRPRVLVAVPGGISPVEKRALFTSVLRAGARQVYLLEAGLAAALGAGLPLAEPVAQMVVVIGAGTTEAVVLSLGDTVASQSQPGGGDRWDEAILAHLRRRHHLRVSLATAERLRIALASAAPTADSRQAEVRGVDAHSGLPKKLPVTAGELRQALDEPLEALLGTILQALDGTPPELAADLVDNGIHLAGGGALLDGLAEFLTARTGLPVRIVPEPATAVIRGVLAALDERGEWRGRWEADADAA